MIDRQFTQRLLSPGDFPPSRDDLKVIGAFNPGAARLPDGRIVLMVRVAESPVEQRDGHHALPSWTPDGELQIEYLPEDQDILIDPRKVVRAADQLMQLKFVSYIRTFVLNAAGTAIDGELAPLTCRGETETFGVEDPRVTLVDGVYYITYVSVSEHGAATSLATTTDFQTYERHGVIFCPENKDVMLLPKKIDDQFVALHRPNTFQRFCKPEMWLATSNDAKHWGGHRFVWSGQYEWDNDRIGAGVPPIWIDRHGVRGWLELYHSSRRATKKGEVGAYKAGLLLLDPDDPAKVIGHTPDPIMGASEDWEMTGFVPNVVFPTGVVEDGDRWLVDYDAADTHVGVTAFSVDDLVGALQ